MSEITVRPMMPEDWTAVSKIYLESEYPAPRKRGDHNAWILRTDLFCLFHVPFLSTGTALIAFSRTEDYNMRLHRRHRLFFVLLYHTRRYCQNKSVRKIHAL